MQVWPMRPALVDAAGNAITDVAAWQRRADGVRDLFRQTLGPTPPSQQLHSYELGRPERDGEVMRTEVTIRVDDDDLMPAWLLQPLQPAPLTRVAIAFHPTRGELDRPHDEAAGLYGEPRYMYGWELARRGWTVLAPAHFSTRARYAAGLRNYDTARLYDRFPEWSSVGKIVRDAQVCLDLLAVLPTTAGLPVSVLGHSLGAQHALYAGVLDERIDAVVCCCGVYPFADARERAHWFRDEWHIYYRDPALKRSVLEGPQPLWDFHEVAALVAPRRLLIFQAPNDEIALALDGIMQMTADLHRVWALLAADRNLTCVLHNEFHAFERHHAELAYAWLAAGKSPWVHDMKGGLGVGGDRPGGSSQLQAEV